MSEATSQDMEVFRVGIEDKVSAHEYVVYGLQHLLALTGIWLLPIVIGLVLNLDKATTGYMIQMCFLTSGLVTILQTTRLLKLPIAQGPTAAVFSAILETGKAVGLGTAYGSLVVASVIWMIIAYPFRKVGLIGLISRFVLSPIVYGSLILIIGASLTNIGLAWWIGEPGSPGYPGLNFVAGLITVLAIMILMIFGSGIVQRGAILWGIIIGAAAYSLFGTLDFTPVAQSSIVGLPSIFPFGFDVQPAFVLLMMVAYIPVVCEEFALYTLVTKWGKQDLPPDRIGRGVFAEMLGCAIGAIFGGIATTSYPENIGILRISKIGSRYVVMTAGIIALVLGFLPFVGAFFASLPGAVISAATTVLFGIIAMSGVQMLREVVWDDLNLLVAGTSFSVAIGSMFLPEEFYGLFSPAIVVVIHEPLVLGAVMLVVLNAIINLGIRPMLKDKGVVQLDYRGRPIITRV